MCGVYFWSVWSVCTVQGQGAAGIHPYLWAEGHHTGTQTSMQQSTACPHAVTKKQHMIVPPGYCCNAGRIVGAALPILFTATVPGSMGIDNIQYIE